MRRPTWSGCEKAVRLGPLGVRARSPRLVGLADGHARAPPQRSAIRAAVRDCESHAFDPSTVRTESETADADVVASSDSRRRRVLLNTGHEADERRHGGCDHSDRGDRERRDIERSRSHEGVRAEGRRASLVRVLGEERSLRRDRRSARHAPRLRHPHAATERDRFAPHGARAEVHARGLAHSVPPHARLQHALAAGDGPRRDRDADGGRAAAPTRGHDASRARARGVREARVAMEGRERRAHRRAAARPRRFSRLEALEVHDGRGHEPRRERSVRAPLRAGAHVPRDAAHQLVPGVPHRVE